MTATATRPDAPQIFAPEPVRRMTRDIRAAAKFMSTDEARYLVDLYYESQKIRIATDDRLRKLSDGPPSPNSFLLWMADQMGVSERTAKSGLDQYTDQHPLGRWVKSIPGIGPVLAASLLAHIDITKAPTAGHIWRFAGYDPTIKWLGKAGSRELVTAALADPAMGLDPDDDDATVAIAEIDAILEGRTVLESLDIYRIARLVNRKPQNLIRLARTDQGTITRESLIKALAKRPWNAELKKTCWKIGESFVKVSGRENDVYGKIYLARKAYEMEQNEAGAYADQAARKLQEHRIGTATDAYKAYSQGKLPPAHIHERSKRYAVKLFLSGYHEAAFFLEYGTLPPKPYVIEHLGHAHYIAPPNMHLIEGWAEARAAASI